VHVTRCVYISVACVRRDVWVRSKHMRHHMTKLYVYRRGAYAIKRDVIAMLIKQGQRVRVKKQISGMTFYAIATEDFDTNDNVYHLKLDQDEQVSGLRRDQMWKKGDVIPTCKANATITLLQ